MSTSQFILLALACRPAPAAAPESTQPASQATPDPTAADPEPADPEPANPDIPEPPAEPVHHGVTDAELSELCEELAIDYDGAPLACDWLPGGQALADGARVVLIELQVYDDSYGETAWAYLILRVGDDRSIVQLGDSYVIPGEEAYYELGRLKIDGDTILLPWTASSDIYPNTGNPGEPSGKYTESASFETRCSIRDVDCERLSLD